jgi:Ca2+-transporting ATPase
MDIAGIAFARQRGFSPAGISLVHSWPIERPVLAVACLWDAGTAEESTLACKGAPESVMALCDLDPESAQSIMRRVRDIAARGERVLALARCAVQRGDIRDHLTDYRFHFVGLAGFNDPVKGGVPGAVRECVAAGIRTIMITGDYPVTAMAVANDAGIDTRGGVLTGDEVARLSQPELSAKLRSTCVLARMVPEQKLRVVRSLQQGGDIVCMTGDGVNDAPALKAAHIGIAMGGRGTDVAREASALVLLDDNFTSIVAAICQGRRIYDNLQKAISYIIAIHVPVIGLALLPLILGVPQILWPVHLAFLELVIDPVCSIVFEAEPAEATVMTRPPRPTTSRLFARDVVLTGFFSGLLAMLAVLVMYFSAGRMGEEADHARAVSFAGLLLINVALILSLRDRDQSAWRRILSRSRQRNLAMARVLGIVAALCAIIFYVPAVSSAFHFTAPHASDLLVVVAVASLLFVIFDLIKSQKKEPRFGGSFVVDHTNVTRR